MICFAKRISHSRYKLLHIRQRLRHKPPCFAENHSRLLLTEISLKN